MYYLTLNFTEKVFKAKQNSHKEEIKNNFLNNRKEVLYRTELLRENAVDR